MDQIILYDDKDVKYETVNFESEYIIYSSVNRLKILGFINFKFTFDNECIIKELVIYPNFKNRLYSEIEDYNRINSINSNFVNNISKILLKKAEKNARESGIQYMIIDGKYIKITKPLSLLYFYIFLSIILGLKILKFLF